MVHLITPSIISDKISSRHQFLNLPQPMNNTEYLGGTIISKDLVKFTLNMEVVPDSLSKPVSPKTTFELQSDR